MQKDKHSKKKKMERRMGGLVCLGSLSILTSFYLGEKETDISPTASGSLEVALFYLAVLILFVVIIFMWKNR